MNWHLFFEWSGVIAWIVAAAGTVGLGILYLLANSSYK